MAVGAKERYAKGISSFPRKYLLFYFQGEGSPFISGSPGLSGGNFLSFFVMATSRWPSRFARPCLLRSAEPRWSLASLGGADGQKHKKKKITSGQKGTENRPAACAEEATETCRSCHETIHPLLTKFFSDFISDFISDFFFFQMFNLFRPPDKGKI